MVWPCGFLVGDQLAEQGDEHVPGWQITCDCLAAERVQAVQGESVGLPCEVPH